MLRFSEGLQHDDMAASTTHRDCRALCGPCGEIFWASLLLCCKETPGPQMHSPSMFSKHAWLKPAKSCVGWSLGVHRCLSAFGNSRSCLACGSGSLDQPCQDSMSKGQGAEARTSFFFFEFPTANWGLCSHRGRPIAAASLPVRCNLKRFRVAFSFYV